MIQIQIAGGLSEQGVSDICWVLLDPADPADPADAADLATPPQVEPTAVAPSTLPAAPAHRVVVDRRAAASRSSQGAHAADESRQVRAGVGDRSDDSSPGKADLVHPVLRLLVLAAALAGAWWLATAKLQSATPLVAQPAAPTVAQSGVPSAIAPAGRLDVTLAFPLIAPSTNPQLSAQASRP